MSSNLPGVTVLIAARPDLADVRAVAAARTMNYPADRLEIIVARGAQPSAQRNAGIRAARGELVFFLDDDSAAQPDALQRAVAHCTDPKVKMVGGPNLCPPDAPRLEQIFARVLSSWLAFGPSRARYAQVGRTRPTSEKELILCNLVARRDTLLELGGFNEALYPNEENALMDEIQKRGGQLIYDPELVVLRRPRRTVRAFARMLFTYGRGRAEQFRVNPTFGSALNFVPPLFCVYLAALPLLPLVPFLSQWAVAPLALYTAALVVQAALLVPEGGIVNSLAALPLIVVSHVFYGLGFWRGLFTRLNVGRDRRATEVKLEFISVQPQQP